MIRYIAFFIIITIFFFEPYLLMTLLIMALHNTLSCVALTNVCLFTPTIVPVLTAIYTSILGRLLPIIFVPIAFNMFGVGQILSSHFYSVDVLKVSTDPFCF